METEEVKICGRCKEEKPLNEFHKHTGHKDGHASQCKNCCRKCTHEWVQQHPGQQRKWCQQHPHRTWSLSTRGNHKRQGYIIEITTNELTRLAQETTNCSICGTELNWNFGTKNGKTQFNSPSLDRENNGKIININTVWIICNRCNATKQNRTWEEFLDYCKMVARRFDKNGTK